MKTILLMLLALVGCRTVYIVQPEPVQKLVFTQDQATELDSILKLPGTLPYQLPDGRVMVTQPIAPDPNVKGGVPGVYVHKVVQETNINSGNKIKDKSREEINIDRSVDNPGVSSDIVVKGILIVMGALLVAVGVWWFVGRFIK